MRYIFDVKAMQKVNPANAICSIIAIVYLGLSLSGKKYGLITFPRCPQIFTMAPPAALFSGVWLSELTAQVYTSAFAEKLPDVYKNAAVYLAAVLSVATEITKPTMEIQLLTIMWYPRSFLRSEDQATRKEATVPRMYGGAVRTRAMVLEPNPKPRTIVGKKLLKPYDDVMKIFIKI